LKKHFVGVFFSFIFGLLTGTATWKALWSRLHHKNSLSTLGAYDADAAAAGIPAPNGVEDVCMGIAIHPEYRGGGNATKLIEHYVTRVFEKGATRIRGAILKNNIASMTFFKKRGWTFMDVSDNEVSVWINKPGVVG
jgi:GNAT superfamily N-acetyltransferase